jgi:predicted transcriptional regulator
MSVNIGNNSELTYNKHLIQLRRSKVLELWSKGWSQERIANELGVSQSLISLDIQFIQSQGREEMQSFITELLPNSIKKTLVSLNLITLEAWNMVDNSHDDNTKLQALKLIKDTEADKIGIVSNVDIINKLRILAAQEEEETFRESLISDTKPEAEEEEIE